MDQWHLRSLTSIQLVHLHMISNTLGSDYRLCDKLQFVSFRVVNLIDFLAQSINTLCLLNESIPRMTSILFDSKTMRLVIKSTPLFYDSPSGIAALRAYLLLEN
jgi:hypothetical protein